MSSEKLYRLSGYSLLVGGSLALLFAIIRMAIANTSDAGSVTSPLWLIVHLMIMLGAMLIVAGLPAVYIRLLKSTGWLGLIGFVLTLFAVMAFGVADMALWAFAIPFIATHMPGLLSDLAPPPALIAFYTVANLVFCVGSILLGIATMRARVLAENIGGTGAALIFAGIIDAVHIVPLPDALWELGQITSYISALFFFIGLAGLGIALLLRHGIQAVEPPLAAPEMSSTE